MHCRMCAPWDDFLITFGKDHKLWSSSCAVFFQPPVTSFILKPNILLSILFSYILNLLFSHILKLCSTFNVTDQDSHSYKTRCNIILFRISVFTFLDSKQEDKRFEIHCTTWTKLTYLSLDHYFDLRTSTAMSVQYRTASSIKECSIMVFAHDGIHGSST
jgi:hypothetical protein